jgi:hypothetical protein
MTPAKRIRKTRKLVTDIPRILEKSYLLADKALRTRFERVGSMPVPGTVAKTSLAPREVRNNTISSLSLSAASVTLS